MYSQHLDEILKSNSVTKKYYQGCHPSDLPPEKNKLRYPAAIIFNLDESDEEGSHWIAMFISGAKRELNYFDSYAIEPTGEIKKFIEKYPKLIRNVYRYQSLVSNVCGHYCIIFLYFLSLGYTFDRFIKLLESSGDHDLLARSIVKEMTK